jgi:hypothetical protein
MDIGKFTEVPGYADVMTAEEWEGSVECGAFIPSDGTGFWCKSETEESTVNSFSTKPEWATHVSWYNK